MVKIGGKLGREGTPHYVAIDRKPDSDCEIQNIADGNGYFMLRLMFVKEADVDFGDHVPGDLDQGTNILMKLCGPWENIWRKVCDDSYLAFVQTAKALYEMVFYFFGVVKTPPVSLSSK